MTIRRILIFAPILLIMVLLQSYFWVPTYEQQTRGNPARLAEYIAGSIGDASLLNPILTADSASSNIQELVFEGLIDRDEQLRFRGRLAKSWKVFEEAFFVVFVLPVDFFAGAFFFDAAFAVEVLFLVRETFTSSTGSSFGSATPTI